MRVFNLTGEDLHFHAKVIRANGGYEDFPEMGSFVSNGDRRLVQMSVISIGALPKWFLDQRRVKAGEAAKEPERPIPPPLKKVIEVRDSVPVRDSIAVEPKGTPSSKRRG